MSGSGLNAVSTGSKWSPESLRHSSERPPATQMTGLPSITPIPRIRKPIVPLFPVGQSEVEERLRIGAGLLRVLPIDAPLRPLGVGVREGLGLVLRTGDVAVIDVAPVGRHSQLRRVPVGV